MAINLKKLNMSILGIIGILVLVVFASGCTSSSNNSTTTNSKNYSSENLTFNYPDSWTLNPNGFVTLGTGHSGGNVKYNAGVDTFSIKELASEPPKIPATMEAVVKALRSLGTETSVKKEITIDGVKGIEYTPTTAGDMGQKRIDVYFAKGDNLYNVWMTSTDYEADISGFNMIINSIKVK